MKKYLMLAALLVAVIPAPTGADWLFTPSIGSTFATGDNGREHFTYGTAIGWMGAGVFGWEADFFNHISMTEHMQDFARGVIEISSLTYYVTVTVFFLFLTWKVVESRRWK